MRRKSIDTQISKIERVFGKRITSNMGDGGFNEIKNCVNLLVVHPSRIHPRDLFDAVNLGYKKHNSWFLDLTNSYDLIEVPNTESYELRNVNITNTVTSKDFLLKGSCTVSRRLDHAKEIFPCFGRRPLTLHEVLNLAFQYPRIFNDTIHGIQAYGSRFTKEVDSLSPSTDDTMEIYRKGNPGKGFLKLAREKYRYSEDTKIIPFVEI